LPISRFSCSLHDHHDTTLFSFAAITFAPGIAVADLNVGLVFFLGMSSLGVYSVVLAGWSSNSKYPLYGAMRAAGQMFGYEVFMGLSLMGVVMMAGSFNMRDIVAAQKNVWFCFPNAQAGHFHDRGVRRNAPASLRSA